MNNTTLLAMLEVLPKQEVSRLSGRSIASINRILSGSRLFDEGDVDVEYLKTLGFRLCESCECRLVPKEPVDYQILTRLCRKCWQGEIGSEEEYELHLPEEGEV